MNKISVVDLAHQIIEMDEKIRDQAEEIAELRQYRQKYIELLHDDIDHGQKMMVGFLDLAMSGRLPT